MVKERNPDAFCGNCPYGVENSDNPLTVDCHRFSAVLVCTAEEQDGNVYHQFQFPAHKHTSFCGEHPNFFLTEDQT